MDAKHHKKKIAIVGSTGSIGTQALEVISEQPDRLHAYLLCGHSNVALLVSQALAYRPEIVITTDDSKYGELRDALAHTDITVLAGQQALCDAVQDHAIDIVLAAIVGVAGLQSTLAAVRASKTVALANKETLVVAGEIVMQEVSRYDATLIPVDSEHSAIYQCLVGEKCEDIERIILTASGGPFRGRKTNFLENVKKEHALQHPNWTMGAKITIDSATLMNKGLEMIEAKHLFKLKNEQIDVIIHPQSIIHSLVEFVDGSQKAQLGLPSMKLPIQYAFSYPDRWVNDHARFNFQKNPELTFEQPDYKTFKNLQLAKDAMIQGGTAPAILNAANEVVVKHFLENKIGFLSMMNIIEQALNHINIVTNPTLEEVIAASEDASKYAEHAIIAHAL